MLMNPQILVTEYVNNGEIVGYGFYDLSPCCPGFEFAWKANMINFGEKEEGFDTLTSKTGFDISQVVPGWEGEITRTNWSIDFCPFCGKPLVWKVAQRGPNLRGAKMEQVL